MERKHATVIALTFVLVGLMFFSVDTPLVFQQEVETAVHDVPEIVEQIADEPVPQEPLRLNVVENPSFEDWDTVNNRPEAWYAQATAYQFSDREYTDVVSTGSYAGYTEAKGSGVGSGSAYLYSYPIGHATTTLIKPGISLSFDWNALANPDIALAARIYFYLQTDNGAGTSYNFYYYLSTGITGPANSSNYARIMMNDTINQWNNFDRNITEDFIAVFGAGPLTDESYVTGLWFYANSPPEATSRIQAVFDDVVLYNSTYSSWIDNGDFESGTGNGWQIYNVDAGYVSQSTDNTHGTYSLNLSIPVIQHGSAYARSYNSFPQNFGYHALYPRMNTIALDWKYNDTVGAGQSQYAYFRLEFYNGSSYYIQLYFGYGTDTIPFVNTTTVMYIKMPGFGVRDTWQYSEFDVYDICNEAGFYNLTLTGLSFFVYQAQVGAAVELLVDGLKMMTYPTSDPTFEYVENWGRFDPFTGWGRFVGNGDVTQSTEAHGGTYSANITVENGEEGIERNLLYAEIDPALFTDFWWRLEDIQSTGLTYAWIDFEFLVSGLNRHITYVLGTSASWPITNTTSHYYIIADGFNQTGTWTHLARNLTADIESAFSTSAADWTLFYLGIKMYAPAGMRTSLLVDDLHFKDMEPPTCDSVTIQSSPRYYESTAIRVVAYDARPGVSDVTINYSIDGFASWNTVAGVYNDAMDWFDAGIPAQAYNTDVEFYAIVTDGCGLQTVNDNGGLFYLYKVDDDIDPTLTIDNPVNNTEQEGLLAITATVDGTGSGVDYVTFNPDGTGPVNDDTAPYSQNWNLDDASLGSHFVIVTVHDLAGNSVTKTHYITVVDTVLPVLDTPDDVEFTTGEIGNIIDWDPTDIRPASYEIFVEEVSTYTGVWNSSAEHLVVELDGLAVGTYNYTCVVYDEAGLSAVDTVMVTVNEVVTTPTTPTTTTGTTDTTTTSGEPTGGGDIMTPLLIVAGIGVVGILLIVFVVLPKMKKT